MRKLTVKDAYIISKCIKISNNKESIKRIANDLSEDCKDEGEIFIRVMAILIDIMGDDVTSPIISQLLEDILQKKVDNVTIDEFSKYLNEIFDENNIVNFAKTILSNLI